MVRSDVGGMRILAAGASDPSGAQYRYRLLEYEFVDPDWSVTRAFCGVAPPSRRRVYPVGGNAVLAIAPSGNDETELRRITCSETTLPSSQRISLGPGDVTDFDIAEELVGEGQSSLAVGWVQDGTVHYAEISHTDSSVDVVRRWSLGVPGIHVRVAYNVDTNTAAVVVHDVAGAALYLVKRT